MKEPTELPKNLVLRNRVLYFRARAGGKLRWRKCPWQDAGAFSARGTVLPCVLKSLAEWMGHERDLADQRARDPDAVPEGRVPSWSELGAAYLEVAAAQFAKDKRPAPATARDNLQRLWYVLEHCGISRAEALDQARPERVDGWIQREVAGAEGEEEEDAVRYRISRTLAMATSAWARWTREPYRRRGIELPICLDRWPVVAAFARLYEDPPEVIKQATREGGLALERDQPAVWLAFALCYYCGMRPGDMQRAEWSWLQEGPDGGAVLRFRPHKTARSTRGREVYQCLRPEFVARLRAAWARCGDGGAHIVPGGRLGRDRADAALSAAMREWGWDGGKTVYELRKLFVSAVYNSKSLRDASEYSGDNATTIERFYARSYRRDAPQIDVDAIIAGR